MSVDTETGELLLALSETLELVERAPIAWQDVAGERNPVNVSYALGEQGELGFTLGAYDPALVLPIDPTLGYSTFLGDSRDDYGQAIAVDAKGNAYVTGSTQSENFPTSNALDASHNGGIYDAFVTKLNATGDALVYSTFLGGNGRDRGNAIAVDANGNAYITGSTDSSTDFTTPNAFDAS